MSEDKTIITVSLTLEAKQYLDFLAKTTANGNRSAWVQRAIMNTMASSIRLKTEEKMHTSPEKGRTHGENKDKCNPNHMKGRCVICWGDE